MGAHGLVRIMRSRSLREGLEDRTMADDFKDPVRGEGGGNHIKTGKPAMGNFHGRESIEKSCRWVELGGV